MGARGPRTRSRTKTGKEKKTRRLGGIEPWTWTGMRPQSPPLLRVKGMDSTLERLAPLGVDDGKGGLEIHSSTMISTDGAGGTNNAAEMEVGVGLETGRNERAGAMDPAGELAMI